SPASPIDEIIITPDAGLFHWLDLYSERGRYWPDYGSMMSMPASVELALNSWVRFDAPGDYSVRVKTNRVTCPEGRRPLVSNDVTFHIAPMSDAEEAAE